MRETCRNVQNWKPTGAVLFRKCWSRKFDKAWQQSAFERPIIDLYRSINWINKISKPNGIGDQKRIRRLSDSSMPGALDEDLPWSLSALFCSQPTEWLRSYIKKITFIKYKNCFIKIRLPLDACLAHLLGATVNYRAGNLVQEWHS